MHISEFIIAVSALFLVLVKVKLNISDQMLIFILCTAILLIVFNFDATNNKITNLSNTVKQLDTNHQTLINEHMT